jgi:anti-sigma regulatory factor (Ser/Thr protein kinase)
MTRHMPRGGGCMSGTSSVRKMGPFSGKRGPHMCYEHEARLVPSAMAPSDARRIVRRSCNELRVEELSDTAALLTSELVTNAIRHAPGPVLLAVACRHGRLVVSVSDTDPRPPQARRARARAIGGRGLALVDLLAERWGSRSLPGDGKAVWFALRPRRPPPTQHSCTCPAEPDASHNAVNIPASRNAS